MSFLFKELLSFIFSLCKFTDLRYSTILYSFCMFSRSYKSCSPKMLTWVRRGNLQLNTIQYNSLNMWRRATNTLSCLLAWQMFIPFYWPSGEEIASLTRKKWAVSEPVFQKELLAPVSMPEKCIFAMLL